MIGSADLTCLPLNFSIFPRFHDRDRSCRRRLFVTAEPSAVNPVLPLTAGTRLFGGGKGVRTTGPLSRNESVSPAEREVAQRRQGQSRKRRISCGGPRVRIPLAPPASLFSPVPSRATGSEPRGLAAVCAWVETEKGTGRPRLVLLGPFSLSGFDAVPLRESYSERPRAASVPRPGSGSSLAANLQVICAARSSRAADRVRSAAWR
jgi:hypothetical protein